MFGGNAPACPNVGRGFIIDDGVTLKGNLVIHTCIELNGVAKVDHASDVMTFGDRRCALLCGSDGLYCAGPKVFGTGEMKVSAGLLRIWMVNLNQATAPDWEISAGTLQVGDDSYGQCTCDDTEVNIELTGGTLNFKADFTTTHSFEASGGTLIKKANKTVTLR